MHDIISFSPQPKDIYDTVTPKSFNLTNLAKTRTPRYRSETINGQQDTLVTLLTNNTLNLTYDHHLGRGSFLRVTIIDNMFNIGKVWVEKDSNHNRSLFAIRIEDDKPITVKIDDKEIELNLDFSQRDNICIVQRGDELVAIKDQDLKSGENPRGFLLPRELNTGERYLIVGRISSKLSVIPPIDLYQEKRKRELTENYLLQRLDDLKQTSNTNLNPSVEIYQIQIKHFHSSKVDITYNDIETSADPLNLLLALMIARINNEGDLMVNLPTLGNDKEINNLKWIFNKENSNQDLLYDMVNHLIKKMKIDPHLLAKALYKFLGENISTIGIVPIATRFVNDQHGAQNSEFV